MPSLRGALHQMQRKLRDEAISNRSIAAELKPFTFPIRPVKLPSWEGLGVGQSQLSPKARAADSFGQLIA